MVKKIIFGIVLLVVFFFIYLSNHMGNKSLGPNRVYIENKMTNDKVTIVTMDTIRYMISGHKHFIPDTNFVGVVISDDFNFGEGLEICWDIDGKDWKAIHTKKIIENKLDPGRFEYNFSLKEAFDLSKEVETLPISCSFIHLNYNLFVHLGLDDGYSVSGIPKIEISRNWF